MTKILAAISFTLFLFSCTNVNFQTVKTDISLLKKEEIVKLPIINDEIEKRYNEEFDEVKSEKEIFYNHNLFLYKIFNLNVDSSGDAVKLTNIISKKEPQHLSKLNIANMYLDSLKKNEQIKKNSVKNEIKRNVLNEKLKGIKSILEIKNTTKEAIEKWNVTMQLNFVFDNNTKKYLKSYPINKIKIWESNQIMKIELLDIIAFENKELANSLEIHKPKKVELMIFLAAENSIGFNNKNEDSNNKFGEIIVNQDITSLWLDD